MTLVAGSYEKFIWGFSLKTLRNPHQNPKKEVREEEEEEEKTTPQSSTLRPLFSYPSHAAAIKCVAVSGPVAVSGGADDTIKVYDLSSSSEIGSLTDHAGGGAVSALAFYAPPSLSFPRNLIAASDSGEVSIYDVDPFVHLKSVRAHRRGVNDVAVHPSGRLALTVGRDSCLAMVNLVRGRRSFCCSLEKEASIVRYGLDGGAKFYMAAEEKISVHDSEDAKLVLELNAQKRVLSVAPGENGLLFTGGDECGITAWDTTSGKVAYCIDSAHSARVKGLVVLGSRSAVQGSGTPYLIASASSDGVIRVWDVRMATKEKPDPLAETNTKSRLTCLAGSSVK